LKVGLGEDLAIVQKDLGSGYTYVRNCRSKVGYVPTSLVRSIQ
jgi:hypothetical protein